MRTLLRFAEWWQRPADDTDADSTLLAALEAALDKLGTDERALIEGRYFAGESQEATGERHALSARAVEGGLARLRIRLRELITKELKSKSR